MPSINRMPTDIYIATKSTFNQNGGQVATYTKQSLPVPALLKDASAHLKMIYAQRNIVIDKVAYITVPINTNTGDIVLYGSQMFFVHAVLDSSGTGRVFEVVLREVNPGTVLIVED